MLTDDGVLLIVQSEFADPVRSVRMLRCGGMQAEVIKTKRVPFGPVLSGRARWMEHAGLRMTGRREEELVVIRGKRL